MSTLDERISKLEAIQMFQVAMLGALSKACPNQAAFASYARENLERQHAVLLAESTNETRLAAYQELMNEILKDK